MVDWTDELRAQVVEDYKAGEPNVDNSMDIVKAIAEDMDATPNGVRAILSKAGVYIKKTPGASTAAGASGDKPKTTRVNKADAQEALTNAIEALGKEADQDIITKLTGKAALYLTEILTPEAE